MAYAHLRNAGPRHLVEPVYKVYVERRTAIVIAELGVVGFGWLSFKANPCLVFMMMMMIIRRGEEEDDEEEEADRSDLGGTWLETG